MQRILTVLALSCALILPAHAALTVGADAPGFTTKATLGGEEFTFSLADALKEGPVVVYFYPAAFTKGCTIEAHAFAEATDEFKANGASIIGVSSDDIETLNRFSVSECQSKFPVASDADQTIMKAYDAVSDRRPTNASRTSYVVSPEGKVLYVHSDMDPTHHVANTMQAVKNWAQEHKTQ
jgi:peroxiredoxin Q/BCP